MKIQDFLQKKSTQDKIVMVTCYDYSSACLLSDTDIDCVLVGDSLAMVMHGFNDTISATLPMMSMHVSAVSRGLKNKFIVGDLPFLSYRQSQRKSVQAAQLIIQSGAHAVKLEGAKGNLKLIQHLVESGVPVMGHIGLTPQFIHQLGGYKVQGKTLDSAKQLTEDALSLQEAGCFAVVLECVPSMLAKTITHTLSVPTIGVGAGPHTDGQVLVWHDLLGMTTAHQPKFVKQFIQGAMVVKNSINQYVFETKNGDFPNDQYCYHSN